MKITFKIITLCFALLIIFSSVCIATDSLTTTSDDFAVTSGNLEKSKITSILNTNNDVYAGNDDISIEGYVNGNSFVFGKKVTISGYVNGDLFVLANSLVIHNQAQVSGNVFALTQDMTISGKVNDVYAFAKTFTLSSTGVVVRNLNLTCSNATLEGKVGSDANLSVDSITFAEGSKNVVGRDLKYSAKQEAVIPEGAVVGKVDFSKVEIEEKSVSSMISSYIYGFFMVVLYSSLVIILATFVTPNFAKKATYSMTKKPFIVALIGIGAIVFTPVVSIILALTGFFAYVSLALITVYLLVLSITIAMFGMAIGNYFADKLKNKTKTKFILLSIASVAVLWLLQKVPFIGGYISIFTVVFGLGIFVYSLFTKKALEEIKE